MRSYPRSESRHGRRSTCQRPLAVDLFCGAGGLTVGLRAAGFEVLGAVELAQLACTAYRANHPDVHLWESDVRNLTGPMILKQLGLERGELDLLAACPPCQGFSSMRTRNGQRWNKDPRNGLIDDVLRLIRSVRPKTVMLENVPALAKGRRFGAFRRGLAASGYLVRWDILNTVDFGVPQRRRRLVLLASRLGTPDFAMPTERRATVRSVIGHLPSPRASRDPLHNYPVTRSEKVREIIRRIPRDGGSRSALGDDQLKCHSKIEGFRDVYGRMAWDKPSPTITGGCINPSKGRFVHPTAHRAITLREAALLQTFPAKYRFPVKEGGKYPVALLIGNALPPEFIRRHALALKRTLQIAPGGKAR